MSTRLFVCIGAVIAVLVVVAWMIHLDSRADRGPRPEAAPAEALTPNVPRRASRAQHVRPERRDPATANEVRAPFASFLVTNAAGAPLRDVSVIRLAQPVREIRSPQVLATSDDAGRVTLADPIEPTISVLVAKSGYLPLALACRDLAATESVILEDGEEIRFKFVDLKGLPIPGVGVVLSEAWMTDCEVDETSGEALPGSIDPLYRARSDQGGSAKISGLQPGKYFAVVDDLRHVPVGTSLLSGIQLEVPSAIVRVELAPVAAAVIEATNPRLLYQRAAPPAGGEVIHDIAALRNCRRHHQALEKRFPGCATFTWPVRSFDDEPRIRITALYAGSPLRQIDVELQPISKVRKVALESSGQIRPTSEVSLVTVDGDGQVCNGVPLSMTAVDIRQDVPRPVRIECASGERIPLPHGSYEVRAVSPVAGWEAGNFETTSTKKRVQIRTEEHLRRCVLDPIVRGRMGVVWLRRSKTGASTPGTMVTPDCKPEMWLPLGEYQLSVRTMARPLMVKTIYVEAGAGVQAIE